MCTFQYILDTSNGTGYVRSSRFHREECFLLVYGHNLPCSKQWQGSWFMAIRKKAMVSGCFFISPIVNLLQRFFSAQRFIEAGVLVIVAFSKCAVNYVHQRFSQLLRVSSLARVFSIPPLEYKESSDHGQHFPCKY